MFPFQNKKARSGDGGAARRPGRGPLRPAAETLETRQLMAYSAFGYSLPDLAVSGYTAPATSPGGTLAVDVLVENRGAGSLIVPTALAPGAISPTDAPASTVGIYASATPNGRSGYVLLGTVNTPLIRQNSDFETVTSVNVPARFANFAGGKFYVTLVVNNDRAILQNSNAANVFRVPTPVRVVGNPLPDLQVVAVDIPSTLNPGDVIAPTIRIENLGTGNPAAQGPVTVALVASLDRQFGAGDAIAATYTINSLPGISSVPTQTTIAGAQNLIPTPNQSTVTLPPFKLPTTPGFYYLAVKIDPANQIRQTYPFSSRFSSPLYPVGPADPYLSPSTVLSASATTTFPNLPVTFVNASGPGQTPIITPIETITPVTPVNPIFPVGPITKAQALAQGKAGRKAARGS